MKVKHKSISSGDIHVSKGIHESGKLAIGEDGTIELGEKEANLLLEHPDFEAVTDGIPAETAKQRKAREAKEKAEEKEPE